MEAENRRVRGWSVEVLRGALKVFTREREIDELARRLGAGVTGSATWTFPSLRVAPDSAWAVLVRDPGGVLLAAAVFTDVPRHGQLVTTFAGSEGGFRVAPLAASRQVGTLLCQAVADEVHRRGRAVDLGPVSVAEPLLRELARFLPTCELGPAAPVPHLGRGSGTDVEAYVSHNMRRTLRKARNRMAADGIIGSVDYVRDGRAVAGLVPAMQDAYRDRDHNAGRASLVDTPLGRESWRHRLLGLIESGCGEVAVFYLDGAFAAYVVGVRDGRWYGIAEGRFRTEHGRYAPGRLLEATVISRALQDPQLSGVDWLSGVAAESLLAANGTDPTVRLVSRSLAWAEHQPHRLPRPRVEEAMQPRTVVPAS